MDRIFDYLEQQLARPAGTWILGCLGVGLLALAVSFVLHRGLLATDAGSGRMQAMGEAIRAGAAALLRTRTMLLAAFAVAMAAVIAVFLNRPDAAGRGHGLTTAICFLAGAAGAAASALLGVRAAAAANVRTAQAAATSGLAPALRAAFGSSAATGFLVVGSGVLGLAVLCLWQGDPGQIFGFALGASSVALFARCGGGIHARAAGIGTGAGAGPDSATKGETSLAEDDPRNPAVVADHVGVVAGVNAGLFEAYVAAGVAATALGLSAFRGAGGAAKEMIDRLPLGPSSLVVAPLAFCAVGVVASIGGLLVVKTGDERKVASVLLRGIVVATLLFAVGAAVVTSAFDLNRPEVTRILTGWVDGAANPAQFAYGGPYGLLIAVLAGLFVGVAIGKLTDVYTSPDHHHVRRVSDRSATGAATNVVQGLAVGMVSTALPTIGVVTAIGVSFWAAGAYGLAVAAVGTIATLAIWLAVDAYGPVARSATGIAGIVRLPANARRITDALDAAGSTTGAIGRGFATASAALTALALLAVLRDQIQQHRHAEMRIDVVDPKVTMGLFLGAMLPFLFSSFAMRAAARAAGAMADEVGRQFREIKGLAEGTAEPDSAACVRVATRGALREMAVPGLLAFVAPLAVGFTLGVQSLFGMLVGATLAGVLMAIFMSNAGGAWDNARKYVEAGVHGGKGSPAHKAAVTGDTVGDPFKDTAGPGLDILVKLMTVVSIVFLPLFL